MKSFVTKKVAFCRKYVPTNRAIIEPKIHDLNGRFQIPISNVDDCNIALVILF